jgi:YD repeat-containing protein
VVETRVISYTYDPLYRLSGAYYSTGESFEYVYDAVGNRTQAVEMILGQTVTINYGYDDLYRLTSAAYSSGESFEYTYDAVGNRLSLTTGGGVVNYIYDAADRLTSVNGVPYTWDNNGNLLSNGVRTFTYDAADRLTGVSGGGVNATYTYNGDGLRVRRVVNGVPTPYVWDVGAGLSSVRLVVDAGTQQILDTYRYAPFGSLLTGGTSNNKHRFIGETQDPTGLYYLRARWYDPTTGRFLTRDPVQ